MKRPNYDVETKTKIYDIKVNYNTKSELRY